MSSRKYMAYYEGGRGSHGVEFVPGEYFVVLKWSWRPFINWLMESLLRLRVLHDVEAGPVPRLTLGRGNAGQAR